MTSLQTRFSLLSTVLMMVAGTFVGAHSGLWLIDNLGISDRQPWPVSPDWLPSRTDLANRQRVQPEDRIQSYLLIGIDDSNQVSPNLEALWVATLYHDHNSVDMIGIPLSTEIRDAFRAENMPYLETILTSKTQGPIVGHIVIDQADFANITDLLGGLNLGGKTRNGLAVLDYIMASNNQYDRLLRQASTIQAMVAAAAVQGEQFNIEDLLGTISSGRFNANEIRTIVRTHPKLQTEQIRVRIVSDSLSDRNKRT